MSHASVVDEDIERLVQSTDEREQVVDRIGTADVTGLGQYVEVRFSGLEFFQIDARLSQGTFVAAGDDEIASFERQCAGNGQTDAAIGASDESQTASKSWFKREFAAWHDSIFSLSQPLLCFEEGVYNSAIAGIWEGHGSKIARRACTGLLWTGEDASRSIGQITHRSCVGGSATGSRFAFPLRCGSYLALPTLLRKSAASLRRASSCTNAGLR